MRSCLPEGVQDPALALVARQLVALLELLLGYVHSELALCRPLMGFVDDSAYITVVPPTSLTHASTQI
jgi:hypothetical protein